MGGGSEEELHEAMFNYSNFVSEICSCLVVLRFERLSAYACGRNRS